MDVEGTEKGGKRTRMTRGSITLASLVMRVGKGVRV